MYLVAMKRFDEALIEMNRALELDLFSPVINVGVGRVLFYARRYVGAAAHYAKTLETNPDFAPCLLDLGATYCATGKYDKAIALLERGLKSGGANADAMAEIVYTHRRAGRQHEADLQIKCLEDLSARRYVSPYALAKAHLIADEERALYLLEQGYADRSYAMIYLDVDYRFDHLRSHPRFKSLLRRLRFRPSYP